MAVMASFDVTKINGAMMSKHPAVERLHGLSMETAELYFVQNYIFWLSYV